VAVATSGINGGLMVLLLQSTAGRRRRRRKQLRQINTRSRSKVCAVSATQPSAIKGSQGFPKAVA
jgi:hypothetical protein